MPFNGSGIFSIVNTFTPGTTISSSQVNANYSDIATGLSDCLTRDGQAGMTAALKLINGNSSVPSVAFSSEPTLGLYRAAAATIGVAGSMDTTGDVAIGGALTVAGNPILPIGLGPLPWSGLTAPSLWVFARGQSLSRTTYAALWAFAQIEIAAGNTLYTNGDGSTTFTVPDLTGRVPAGKEASATRLNPPYFSGNSTTMGATGGVDHTAYTIAKANLPNYSFDLSSVSVTVFANDLSGQRGTNPGNLVSGLSNGGGGGTENATYSFNGSISLGGSGTALNVASVMPAIITNYIIYAGA